MEIKSTKYTNRFLASFLIEAKTPLAVGSGEKDILTDALVATDVNGLPYIPGSAIAGVTRSLFEEDKDKLFGFQDGDNGHGSLIIFSEAKLVDQDGGVLDGLLDAKKLGGDFLAKYLQLPIRQHVNITGKGTAADRGKFDEQVVYAGTRFYFELEILSEKETEAVAQFREILSQMKSVGFRLGSGTRSGFGELHVVEAKTLLLDLAKSEHLQTYLEKPANLSDSKKWAKWTSEYQETDLKSGFVQYTVTLKPVDFFLFGSGFGDTQGDADMTGVRETKVKWVNNVASFENECILIPGSSVKGALRHRVAYYYNKVKKQFADHSEGWEAESNAAVTALFGKIDPEAKAVRGHVLVSDIIEKDNKISSKLLNHISIDRFTGGGIEGALFTEKVDQGKGAEFKMEVMVDETSVDEDMQICLKNALYDMTHGMLPLGGGVNRGNGLFGGEVKRLTEDVKWTRIE